MTNYATSVHFPSSVVSCYNSCTTTAYLAATAISLPLSELNMDKRLQQWLNYCYITPSSLHITFNYYLNCYLIINTIINTTSVGEWRKWAWSKWESTCAARRLALHAGRGRQAGAARKITVASNVGLDWGHSSFLNTHKVHLTLTINRLAYCTVTLLLLLFMVALCNRADHYIFALWLLSFFISSPNLSGRRLDVYHTSTHGVTLV